MDDHGVLIFLAADNDLNPYARLNDLVEIQRAQAGGGAIPVCVQLHSPQDTGGGPLVSIAFRRGEVVATLNREHGANTGHPSSLADFIRWGAAVCECRRHSLIIWGHGSGALDVENQAELAAHTVKSVAFDSSDEDALTTVEMARAMQDSLNGRVLDVLGFDACYMASVEVMAEVLPLCRTYVASETVIPPIGWPYDLILDDLAAAGDGLSSAGAASVICGRYLYRISSDKSVCISAVDCAKVPGVLAAVGGMVETFTPAMADPRVFRALFRAAQACVRFGGVFVDLGDFMHCLARQDISPAMRAVALAVRDAVAAAVMDSAHANLPRATGMSVMFPFTALPSAVAVRYAALAFSRETGWHRLLAAFHAG
jgi:hypothetical protein